MVGRLILAGIAFLFCIGDPRPVAADQPLPTDDWRVSTPEAQGMDSGRLADLIAEIENNGGGIDSVTIIRNGHLVLDAYFAPFERGLKHIIHSVTKSVTSSLIGIAIDRGDIESVFQPVLDFFPDRVIASTDQRKRAITLEHLLTMTAGSECQDSFRHRWRGLLQMRRSTDWTQHVLDLPMREAPGQNFDYCNGVSFLLSAIIESATGMSAFDYAKQHLFAPLGITDVIWPADPQGVSVGYGEMWLKPRDMAKFGQLYLDHGRWDGRQIVSSAWVAESTGPRVDATLFAKYGYQWWHDAGDYYAAVGFRGQYIFVVPKHNMVVVFTSDLPSKDFYVPRDLLLDYAIPAATSDGSLPANNEQHKRLNTLLRQSASNPRFTWQSSRRGYAAHGVFRRQSEPAFQFRVPRSSRRLPLQSQFQVMRMKTLSGFNFAAAVGDIPAGIALQDVGPRAYAPLLAGVARDEPEVVSNAPIVLDDGTAAYRTELHWRNRLGVDIKTLVVSAFKDGKWVLVDAHPWKDQREASQIVESLTFQIGDQ